ncbi:MAG TPA: C-type lectin domain-containing protein, partial [Polyangia bacterium]|nr:C-type lectin domain-containing protein [Polyangia bacterium]
MKGWIGLRSLCWLAAVVTWTACRAPEAFHGPPGQTGTGGAISGDGGDSGVGGDSGNEEDSGSGGIIGSGGSIADAPADLPSEPVDDAPADVAADQAGDAPRDLVAEAPPCVAPAGCFCETYGAHAYSFCGTLRTYQAAAGDCTAQSMRLVRIDDAAENLWAYGRKAARGFTTTWIGAND